MNARNLNYCTILMADDDPDDRFLINEIFQDLESDGELHFVEDGEELMHYLRRTGKYTDLPFPPRPTFILLDLNMPRKDGRQALQEIKTDPDLLDIPVVVWTTSQETADKVQCCDAGADFYMTKPANYATLTASLRNLIRKYCL